MKVYTYSEARQKLSEVLDTARRENVIIRRRSGDAFVVSYRPPKRSPFDVPGVKTQASTEDILKAIRESRCRDYPPDENEV
jgi:prevent-host-death family protein